MEIEYMKMLKDHPAKFPKDKFPNKRVEFRNRPINYPGDPMAGIQQLENEYNNGNPFPKAYRKYLFLAGDFCYVHESDVGDARKENDSVANQLQRANKVMNRPFFVFESMSSSNIFFYLDEGKEDPDIYDLLIDCIPTGGGTWSYELLIEKRDLTLKGFIEQRIQMELNRVKSGYYDL